jgi:undecaprenyl-diphosphatase
MAWAGLFCALVFALLAWRLKAGGLTAFDDAITGWVRADSSPGRTSWMILFTDLGNFDFVAALSAFAAIILFVCREWGEGLGVAVASLSSWSLYSYLKLVFQRPRPDLPHLVPAGGYSFPSGHALATAALFFSLALVSCRHIGSPANACRGRGRPGSPALQVRGNHQGNRSGRVLVWAAAVLLVLLVGISRVYLGVHYPSDVVAGWAVGGLVVLVIAMLLRPGSRAC